MNMYAVKGIIVNFQLFAVICWCLVLSRTDGTVITVNFDNVTAFGASVGSCIDPIGLIGNLTTIDYSLTIHQQGNTWASDIFVVLYNPPSKSGRQLGGYNDFTIPEAANVTQYEMPVTWRNAATGTYSATVIVDAYITSSHDVLCIGNGYEFGTETVMSASIGLSSLELLNATEVPTTLPTSPSSIPTESPSSTPSSVPSASPSSTMKPTGSPGDVLNMITKSVVHNPWMETGRVYLNDQQWVNLTTESSDFSDPAVFISVPSIGTSDTSIGLVVAPRVHNIVVTGGKVSFDVKLYQANDSFCSKQWYIPQEISPDVKVSWIVAEKGAYNVSGNYFMVGSGDINRPSSAGSDDSNAIRVNFPTGCVSSTVPCRFGDGTDVAAVQQLQTLVYDRFLTVRAKIVGLGFARYVLIPHSAADSNYLVLPDPELVGYIAFDSAMNLNCMERISFLGESTMSNSLRTDISFGSVFADSVNMFGMISTITSNIDATSLRTFSPSQTGVSFVLQEDQCQSEQTFHSTIEKVSVLSIGELSFVTSEVNCKVQYKSIVVSNTNFPSSAPSCTPSQDPSSVPSFSPSVSLEPTGSPGDVLNMITKSVVHDPWMETGQVYLNDQQWVNLTTESSDFSDPAVFISVPSIGTSDTSIGLVVAPRVHNIVVTGGKVSFDVKLYQANDSFCSKQWYIPQEISPDVKVSWIVAEKGAYNVSGNYFMVDSGDINRPSSAGSDDSNAIRVNFPTGCVSSTVPCRFDDGTDVAAVQQLQTLVYDRFLTVRAKIVGLGFARYVLIPHSAADSNYLVLPDPELVGYIAFDSAMNLNCMERISLRGSLDSVSGASAKFSVDDYNGIQLSMFGMILTITANNEATVLRGYNYSTESVSYVLQEDQCVTESAFHATGESVGLLIMGEQIYVTSGTECKINYHNLLENMEFPTSAPSISPTSQPSRDPSSAPTELGDMWMESYFDQENSVSQNISYLVVSLYDTFGDGWENGTSFYYWIESHGRLSNINVVSLSCSDPQRVAYFVPLQHVMPDQLFHMNLNSTADIYPGYATEMHWTVQVVNASSSGADTYREKYYGGFNSSMVFKYNRKGDSFQLMEYNNLWVYPPKCFSSCRIASAEYILSLNDYVQYNTVESFVSSSYGLVGESPYTDAAWFIFNSSDVNSLYAYGTSNCVSSESKCRSCLSDGSYIFRTTGISEWSEQYDTTWEFCGLALSVEFRFQLEFSIKDGKCLPGRFNSAESLCRSTPPTLSPSELPSLDPTLHPSHNPSSILYFDLFTDAVLPLKEGVENAALHVAYFEAIWEDEFVLGTSDSDWGDFLFKMQELDVSHAPISLIAREIGANCSVCKASELNEFKIVNECTDPVLVRYLWRGLIDEGYSVVNCGGTRWQTQACNDDGVITPRFCVDCVNPCDKAEDSSGITLPTSTEQHWVPVGGHAALIGFQVELKEQMWPTWTQVVADVEPTSVIVEVNGSNFEDGGGVSYCSAVDFADLPLSSEFQVLGSEHYRTVLRHGSGMIEIDDLEPGTSYRIYCASQAFKSYPGSLMQSPLSYMESTAFNITTPGKRSIVVQLLNSIIDVGDSSHVLSLSVDSQPESEVQLNIVVLYSAFNDTLSASGPGNCPAEFIQTTSIAKSSDTITFSPSSNVRSREVYIRANLTGCYQLVTSIEGVSSSEYSLISATSTSAVDSSYSTLTSLSFLVAVVSDEDVVSAPSIISASFNDDGSKIHVKFDSPFDRVMNSSGDGSVSTDPFPCHESLRFLYANLSTCVILPDNTIEVILPSIDSISTPPGLPVVGNNITILPNQFKAACRRNTSCSDYPYVEESSVILTAGDDVAVPVVIISTSAAVSLLHDIHLDVSASHSDGGRGWSSVNWTVFHPSGNRNVSLENYMNDESSLSWFGCFPGESKCDVIPQEKVDDGVYTFILSLSSFLGSSSLGAATVTVRNELHAFPTAYIDGPSYRVITPADELDLTCYVDIPDVVPAYSTPLSFSWSVLRDDVVTYSVANQNVIDPRRFGTDPFDLEPGHSYVFQVIVSSESGDKVMAQSMVYVDYGDIVPAVKGGDNRIVEYMLDSEFDLDASLTYDMATGTKEGLEFLWTCVQVIPLNSNGCDRFNALSYGVLSNDTLSLNVSALFDPSSTYMFTLHVSGPRDRYVSKSIELSTGGAGISIPEVSLSSDRGSILDLNGFNDLVGTTVSSSGVSITLVQSPEETLLESFVNEREGATPIVYVLQPMLYFAGPLYSFTLRALQLDCSVCEGYATISVTFNAPPHSGHLSVHPVAGEGLVTLFSLHTAGWLDENLPYQYAFYRDVAGKKSLLLQSYSFIAMCKTTLVSGDAPSNYTVTLLASVRDALSSATNAEANVTVVETRAVNATDVLKIIGEKIDKGVAFKDSVELMKTLTDVSVAFESSVFNCTASVAGEYSEECVELAVLGIHLIKKLVAISEQEPSLCNHLVSNAVVFLEGNMLPELNTSDLIVVSSVMADCIVSAGYNDINEKLPAFDYFIYANGVIEVIKNIKDALVAFNGSGTVTDANGVTVSPDVFSSLATLTSSPVIADVIKVAQCVYGVLDVGEIVTGYESLSMLSINIMKVTSWSDDGLEVIGDEDGNHYRGLLDLRASIPGDVLNTTSSIGLVRVVTGDGYICDNEVLPCVSVTGELYTQLHISTTVDIRNSSATGKFDLSILPWLELFDVMSYATFYDPTVAYQSCSLDSEVNPEQFDFDCSVNDTHGVAYLFENNTCLPSDGNLTWEFTCPLYNTILACASRRYDSGDVKFIPMDEINNVETAYQCIIDMSSEWLSVSENGEVLTPLPFFENHKVYVYESVVAGVYARTKVDEGIVNHVTNGNDLLAEFNLFTDAVLPLKEGVENAALHVAYFEAIWEDEFVLGTSDSDWGDFLFKMQELDVSHAPISLIAREIGANCSVCKASELNEFKIVNECTDPVLVRYLWRGLIDEGYSVVNCNGTRWQTQACNDDGVITPRFCVDCVSPCDKAEDSSGITLPTSTEQHWVPVGGHAALIGFQVELKEQVWPTWTQVVADVEPTSVIVEVNGSNFEDGGGVIYCSAVDFADLPLSSEFQVLGSEHYRTVLRLGSGMIEIDDLEPGTSYRIYCASQAFKSYPGSLMQSPLSYMESTAFNITTPGKRSIVVQLLNSIIDVGDSSHVLSLSVDSQPESEVQLNIVVLYSAFNDTLSASGPGNCPAEFIQTTSIAKSSDTITFSPSSNVRSREVYIRANLTGCYQLVTSIEGVSSSEYSLISATSTSAVDSSYSTLTSLSFLVAVVSDEDVVSAPSIISASFNDDGSKIHVKFDSPFDRVMNSSGDGSVSTDPFPCHESLRFLYANLSTCVILPDNTIEVILPSIDSISTPPGLPVVGNNITILPNQFKAACRRYTSCSDYPYVEESSVILTAGDDVAVPVVIISTSAAVSLLHDIHLDVSASHSDGGRGWSSVNWTVFHPSGNRNVSLENYMNDESSLSWFGCFPGESKCDVIPQEKVDDGVYTFVLSLSSFLGSSSLGAATVTVRDELHAFPTAYIDGPSYRVITPADELDLTCYVDIPDVVPAYSTPLSFSWSVLRDDVVTYSVANQNVIDPRRFGTDPFDLEPGHSYVFQVIVSSESGDKVMAQSMVYVDYGDIVPAVKGGDNRIVEYMLDSEFDLDASLTYDMATGTKEGLEFLWTCVQVIPLNSNGCDRFNTLSYGVLSNDTLSLNVSALFDPSSTYMFTLHVSGPHDRYVSKSIELSTGGAGISIPEVSLSSDRGSILDQNGFNDLVGTTVSSSGVSITLVQSPEETLLKSFVNEREGATPMVYVLQPMLYFAGPLYSFTLRALQLDCSVCEGYATISVTFNAPPRSGHLSVHPVAGEGLVTLFSLHTAGWLDENLPYQYAFYRDVAGKKSLLLQSYSFIAMCKTTLVSGDAPSNYTVTLLASVRDALSSATNAEANVTVVETRAVNATDVLKIIGEKIDKGVAFKDSVELMKTLTDVSVAFESSVFNCTASVAGEYSEECVELAVLGIHLIKKLVAISEQEPSLCNHLVSNAVVFLEGNMLPELNTSDLIVVSSVMADCIVSAGYNDINEKLPAFDYFIYANGVIEVIKNINDALVAFNGSGTVTDANGVTVSPDVFSSLATLTSSPVIADVIKVAQCVYGVLDVGEIVTGYESLSMLSINIMKVTSWSDDGLEVIGDEDGNHYRSLLDLRASIPGDVLNATSSIGLVRVVTGDGYICDNEVLPCVSVTGELYTQLHISTTVDIRNSSATGKFDLSILPWLELFDVMSYATFYDPTVAYQSCSLDSEVNPEQFDFDCSVNDTHGVAYLFENNTCLPSDGNLTWEFTCPLYNTVLACASRRYDSGDVKFIPMDEINNVETAYQCIIDLSSEWLLVRENGEVLTPFPFFENHKVYVYESVVAGVYARTKVDEGIVNHVTNGNDLLAEFNLFTDAVLPLKEGVENAALHVAYFEAIWEDEFVLGTSDSDWGDFLFKMQELDVSHAPISLIAREIGANCSVCKASELNEFKIVNECTDPVLVRYLWRGLIDEGYSVVNCNGTRWQTQACNDDGVITPRFCVDCVSPCDKAEDSSGITLPTSTEQHWVPVGGHAALIGFQVELKEQMWPTWTQVVADVEPTSVIVEVNGSNFEDGGGVIYCSAVDFADLPLSSEFQVLGSEHYRTVLRLGSGMIEIDDLEPGTSYRIYCASQAFKSYPGSLMQSPLSYMESTAFNITTPGKRSIVVQLLNSIIDVGDSSHVLSLSVDSQPESEVQLNIVVLYSAFNDTLSASGPGNCPAEFTQTASIAKSSDTITFSPSSNVRSREVYIRANLTGCYQLVTSIEGVSSSEYSLISATSTSAVDSNYSTLTSLSFLVAVVSDEDVVSAPSIISASFNDDGSKIHVKFDSPFDRVMNSSGDGSVSTDPFPCHESLRFLYANLSTCVILPDNTIEVILPSIDSISTPPGLPVVGNNITILPNQFKAACRRNTSCSDYPYIEESSVILTAGDDVAVPVVIISTSAAVSPLHDIHLDVSASHSDGGRGWSSVNWTVFHPSGNRNVSLENYMNDESSLSWFGCFPGESKCDVIPQEKVDDGVYTFVLSLSSFLGSSSLGAATVTVRDELHAFPTAYIDGPSYRVITPADELDLTCYVDIPDVVPAYSTPLSFSWSVLRDDVVTYSVANQNVIDPRRFGTDPFDLEPGHSYVFQVIVSSESGDKVMAQSVVYVDYGDIVPAVKGGDNRIVEYMLDSEFDLDASLTYDMATGTKEGLEFLWTCVQVIPLNSNGCDRFNTLSYGVLSNDTLSLNVSALFDPSSTYMFTLHVSGPHDRYVSKSIELSTGGAGISIPEVSLSSDRGSILDQNGFNDLVGTTVSSSGVSITLVQSPEETLLKSFVNEREGATPMVYVLQPMLYFAGPLYSFTLRASQLDCSACEGYATISVTFNAPPRSGHLSVHPVAGEGLVTLFSLHTAGWLDENLPYQYAFYRDVAGKKSLLLQSYSFIAMCKTTLVSGDAPSNYTVTLLASVRDALSSATNAEANVTVVETRAVNATDVLKIIGEKIDKGVAFKDSVELMKTLTDVSVAFESSVFNCTASVAGEYSEECVELAVLGIHLIKKLVAISEQEPSLCNHLVSNAVVFLEGNMLPELNTSDLIVVSSVMADCIVSAGYNDINEKLPAFDYFIYANGVIEVIKNIKDALVAFNGSGTVTDANGVTVSPDVFSSLATLTSSPVIADVIKVAQCVYGVLDVGEIVTGYESLSMLSINIMKVTSWSDDGLEVIGDEDGNRYRSLLDLRASIPGDVLNATSSIGLVRVVTGDGYICDNEVLPCVSVTGELYTQLHISTTVDIRNSSATGKFDLSILPWLELFDVMSYATFYDPTVAYQSCSLDSEVNPEQFDFDCSVNDTHGVAYLFENNTCLPSDGNLTWEFTCPLYNTILACASRRYDSGDVKFIPMDEINNVETAYQCIIDLSSEWLSVSENGEVLTPLPFFENHKVYVYESVVAGVYATPVVQEGAVDLVPRPSVGSPTHFPTGSIDARSSGPGAKQYTSFPAGLTLLGTFSVSVFFLAIWISMAGKTPKIYSKKSLV